MAPHATTDDFVPTLSDGEAFSDEEESALGRRDAAGKRKRGGDASVDAAKTKKKKAKTQPEPERDGDVDSELSFGLEDGYVAEEEEEWEVDAVEAIVRGRRGEGEMGDGESDGEESDASDVPLPEEPGPSDSEGEEEEEDAAEETKRTAFFAQTPTAAASDTTTFASLHLSRPIMRGLASLNFTVPTPIQSQAIPVALEGADIVGSAVTGSGKTAAFMVPLLERLLYRPKKTPTTRVVILMPTRELALQCLDVGRKLARFTDITFAAAVGGLSAAEQERQLRTRPDVVVATPGRFIDLALNTPALALAAVEILVLDEADRMLDDGFAAELNDILARIPRSRQTLLFSATMTSKVDDLVRAGLQRPVRISVDAGSRTVSGLVQEFVRLREGQEDKRCARVSFFLRRYSTTDAPQTRLPHVPLPQRLPRPRHRLLPAKSHRPPRARPLCPVRPQGTPPSPNTSSHPLTPPRPPSSTAP